MTKVLEIPYPDISGTTLMLFSQTCRLLSKYMESYFNKYAPVSYSKFLALKMIQSKNGVINPKELAELTQTEMHSVTTLVARMKRDGLVSTERNEIDRRSTNIILTDKGRQALEKSMPVARGIIAKIMASMSENDSHQLIQLADIIRKNTLRELESIARE